MTSSSSFLTSWEFTSIENVKCFGKSETILYNGTTYRYYQLLLFLWIFSGLNVEKCRMSDHDQKPIFIYLSIWNSFLNKFYRVSLHEPHYGHLRPYICYMYLHITLILEKNIHFLKMSIKIWNIITPLIIFMLYVNWTFIHIVGELKDSTKRSVWSITIWTVWINVLGRSLPSWL